MLLEIGSVLRPHGIKGDVVVVMVTNHEEHLKPGSLLQVGTTELEVLQCKPAPGTHTGRAGFDVRSRWLVRFRGVENREAAEFLRGAVVRAEPIRKDGELLVHELIGLQVRDQAGRLLGNVVAVEANPASDLLVLDNEALVPICFLTEFVSGESLTVAVPEGLVP
jgi:16S rRNA processing protein RimM